jgi:hypothetical protein
MPKSRYPLRTQFKKCQCPNGRGFSRKRQPNLIEQNRPDAFETTPRENRQLSKLIDHRYANIQSAFLVGNPELDQTAAQLMALLGDQVEYRIHDGGIIECGWDSLRGRIP